MPTRHALVTPPASLVTKGRNNRGFHGPRATSAFTQDPPGFQTEKDPRGKPDNKWFNLVADPANKTAPTPKEADRFDIPLRGGA